MHISFLVGLYQANGLLIQLSLAASERVSSLMNNICRDSTTLRQYNTSINNYYFGCFGRIIGHNGKE